MRPLFCLAALVLAGSAHAAPDCAALYRQHLESDLKLSYQEFDQTMGRGFRALAAKGCDKEAADLIAKYIEVNKARQTSLFWHIAQLRAEAGQTPEAIRYARMVVMETEDLQPNPLRWNDYVLATIAFLERDKPALIRHRDKVAAGVAEYAGNAMNLKLLDSLIRHFDKSYKYAVSHIGE